MCNTCVIMVLQQRSICSKYKRSKHGKCVYKNARSSHLNVRSFIYMSVVVLRGSLPFFLDSETIEDSAILSSNSTMRQTYIDKLASYLAPVLQSGSTGWRKCYQATVHGWDTKNFHFRCNYKGPTVTIVRFGKYIFGAYASVSWQGKLTGENNWWCLS